jgi:hypothetical protein
MHQEALLCDRVLEDVLRKCTQGSLLCDWEHMEMRL